MDGVTNYMKLYFETERLANRQWCIQYFLFKMHVQYSPSLIFFAPEGNAWLYTCWMQPCVTKQ